MRDIFQLTWPMTLKAIFLHAIIVVDGLLVSPLGERALAAMGLAAALGGILLGAIFAFTHALQIRTAQACGTGEAVFRKSVLVSGLAVSMALGGTGAGLLGIFGQELLGWLAPSPDIAAAAWSYLRLFLIVILGESLGQAIASHFNGSGRTKIPLLGYCLSVPVNVLSSYALIHGLWSLPATGVAGAAMGSALGVLLQTAYLAWRLWHRDGFLFSVAGWQNGTASHSLRRHLVFSLPIAATFISANFSGHVCTLIYSNMTLEGFAAMTLIAPWNLLAGQIAMQWTQGTGVMVAQLLGARAPAFVLDLFVSRAWRGTFVAGGIVAAIFLIMCLSLDVLYPGLEPATRAILWGFLPLLLSLQIPRATNAICGNILRASGDTVYVMYIFLWSQWAFRVPMTALFVMVLDLPAFWVLSLLLAEEIIKFLPFHTRLWRGNWKCTDVSV